MAPVTKFNSPAPAVTLKATVQALKALAHPVRFRILSMLTGRTVCVCQLASVLELAYPTVSGHLNELRRSGLVIEDKQGKVVFYRLDAASPFAGLVTDALALPDPGGVLAHDRELIERVRAVPIPMLTGAGLSLRAVGIDVERVRATAGAGDARPRRA